MQRVLVRIVQNRLQLGQLMHQKLQMQHREKEHAVIVIKKGTPKQRKGRSHAQSSSNCVAEALPHYNKVCFSSMSLCKLY